MDVKQIKSILITGGATGIGADISRLFALNNFKVAILYNKSESPAKKLIEELYEYNKNIIVVKADLTQTHEIDEAINYVIKCFGRIDILVNNAGISEKKLLIDLNDEQIYKTINSNLTGTMILTKKVVSNMLKHNNGKIINIASIWGVCGASNEVVYSASKAGLIGFTKALAKELAFAGITVNSISPGATDTEMMRREYSEQQLKEICGKIGQNRLCNPKEIAELVYYIASEKANYITGQNIIIDGGYID